jgi:hypothetical protein
MIGMNLRRWQTRGSRSKRVHTKKLALFGLMILRAPGLTGGRGTGPLLLCFLAVALIVPSLFWPTGQSAEPGAPSLFLWAWERKEDLSFIDPRRIGVAYLAGTVLLKGPDVEARPRLQPLKLPKGTHVIAVVRVERRRAELNANQCERCASGIIQLVPRQGIKSLQIDFDAAVSERPFYAALLTSLRSQLPQSCGLSMTALASWCAWDDWVSDLPVLEAVPMVFRMGRDGESVIHFLSENGGFRSGKCKASVGISVDEPVRFLPPCERVFVFNPHPWSRTAIDRVTEEVKRWQARH